MSVGSISNRRANKSRMNSFRTIAPSARFNTIGSRTRAVARYSEFTHCWE